MTTYTERRVNGAVYGVSAVMWSLLAATEPRQAFAGGMWVVAITHCIYSIWSFVESTR